MKLVRKNISIELRTVIEDQGEKELSIIKQTGTYVKKENIEVISFIEKANELGNVENLITIRPNKINIKRSGKVEMNQQFIKENKRNVFTVIHTVRFFRNNDKVYNTSIIS